MQNYKVRLTTKDNAILYKAYNEKINQVLYVNEKHSTAYVELSCNDIYINQALLDELQIALNRAKKDLKEIKERGFEND